MLAFLRSTTRHAKLGSKSVQSKSTFGSAALPSIFATSSVRTLNTDNKLQSNEPRAKITSQSTRSVFAAAFKPFQNLSNLLSSKKAHLVQARALQTTATPAAQATGFFNKPLSFWRNWLLVTSAGFGVFGLDMMLFQNLLDSYLWNPLLFSKSHLHETFSPEVKKFVHFTFGVLGAVSAGWAATMYYQVKNSFMTRDIRVWNTLAFSIGLWFTLDSSFSVAMGYWPNAALNVDLALLFAIPLLASRKYFKKIEGPTA